MMLKGTIKNGIKQISLIRKIFMVCGILLTTFFSSYGQEAISNLKLSNYIDSLCKVDQQVQQDAIEAYQRTGSIDTFIIYEKVQIQTFERHIPLVKKIIKEFGYPTFAKVGKKSSSNFFPLIQHSDKDVKFQSQVLKLLKKQVENKESTGSSYAFLYDRVKINMGKKQLYGTQVTYDINGNAIPKNLEDGKSVNKRRKEFNMLPIEQYLSNMSEIHKKQNSKK